MQVLNDVGTLSIGGSSFLAVFEDVQWESEGEHDAITGATRFRAASNAVKANAKMTVPMRAVKSGQTQVSHLDLSVATLAGLSFAEEMQSVTFKVGNNVQPIPNAGEFMRRYQVDPGGSLTADISAEIADSASNVVALMALLESGDPDDMAAVLAITLNSQPIAAPGHIRRVSHSAAGRQKATLTWEGSDPGGTYPTNPTGTSTLLERAINASRTPLAFTYVSKNVGGLSRSGYVLIESAEVMIEDAKISKQSYAFRISAPWTATVTS